MKLEHILRLGIAAAGFLSLIGMARSQNATTVTPSEVLADQLRSQGYRCDRALGSEQDAGSSKPNEAVWVLKCTNGSYRMRLVPDMAARVERID